MDDVLIHPSAVIDAPCTVGKETKIWHFCHVMPHAIIGEACVLGQNVFVGEGVRIGNRVRIQNNVSVYAGVTLEDDVFVGPSATFTNDRLPRSREGFSQDDAEKTIVERGASIGANATIICGVRIGHSAMIGAGSVVTKDVPPHALVFGNPAELQGWVCACGEKISEDAQDMQCAACARNAKVVSTMS